MRNRQAHHHTARTMRRMMAFWCVGIMLAMGVGANFVAEANCHGGPERAYFRWAMVEDANPLPNGLMWVGYREHDQSVVTHASLHRVVRVLPGSEVTLSDGESERLTLLVSDGTLGLLSYVIVTKPLFYGTDLDEIGMPRQLWLDAEEDGINGNEIVAPQVAAELSTLEFMTSTTSHEE